MYRFISVFGLAVVVNHFRYRNHRISKRVSTLSFKTRSRQPGKEWLVSLHQNFPLRIFTDIHGNLLQEQAVMAFGGLRGAIAFALAFVLVEDEFVCSDGKASFFLF